MAQKFKQPQLPFASKDVEDAIKEREGDLAKLDRVFSRTKAGARSIRHKLTIQSTGAYPDSDSDDPVVDAAHKKSVDMLEDYKRLMRAVPAKAAELDSLREEAEKKKDLMDKIVSDGSSNAINTAEFMKNKLPKDKMKVMVQAVTTRQGSLDFLRSLDAEHRKLLLTEEEEIAEYKRSQQAGSGTESDDTYGDEVVIPATDPPSQHDSTQVDMAGTLAAVQSACSKAERRARDLDRQVADMKEMLAEERQANASAQDALRKQLSDADEALEDKDSTLDQKQKQLVSFEDQVAQLEGEASKMQQKISELEAGVIQHGDLKTELDESRSEVETLREQVEKMKQDVAVKPVLEDELAQKQDEVGILEKYNTDLRQNLQGKIKLLAACTAAKESAQELADQCQADLSQRTAELANVRSLQKKLQASYSSSLSNEKDFQNRWQSEYTLRQATHEKLLAEQGKCEEKEAEVLRLQASVDSKDEEIRALKDEVSSKDGEISRLGLRINDKDEELQSKEQSAGQLKADLEQAGIDKAEAELDLGVVISLSNLSIRAADVQVQDWIPLLRSLRANVPDQISPAEDISAQVWAVLPSWAGSSPDEEAGLGSSELPGVPSSPDGLLFELFAHAMAEGGIRCNACLRALCALSGQVGRHGVTKAGSFVIVLEKLEALVRSLEAISGHQGMVILGLRYLTSLVRSRVPGGDAPRLSAVEDSLDAMIKQAGESLGIIRHVSDALFSSGDIGTAGGLHLTSAEGRRLIMLAESGRPGELFLLADPEIRTVRAVSCDKWESNVRSNEAGALVESAVLKTPADQSDLEFVLTEEDADWIQKNL